MTDLTEKNLEATLLNLTKTDRPIAIKPTTWFGNLAKTAQWYTCPNCAKQSPLTIEWVEQEPVAWMHTQLSNVAITHRPADLDRHPDRWTALYSEPKLKDKNDRN